MNGAPRPTGEKRRRFEWRVIRIPIYSVQFLMIVIVAVALGVLAWKYREKLPLERLRLPAVFRSLAGRLGLGGMGSAETPGGRTSWRSATPRCPSWPET